MRATLKFTGSLILQQVIGGPDEMCDAIVYCTFGLEDGRELACQAKVKQTVGSASEEKMIEVHSVEGLPPGAEYDHDAFAEAARRYFTRHIMKQRSDRGGDGRASRKARPKAKPQVRKDRVRSRKKVQLERVRSSIGRRRPR